MKNLCAISLFVLVFASCEKSALPDVQPAVAETEKTADPAAAGQQLTSWSFEPAILTYTDCTTKPLRTGCGNYSGGLQTQYIGMYATLTQIQVQRCDGLAFAKQAAQLEVHADSVCGKLVARSTIKPNQQWGTAIFDINSVRKTSFYSIVILPGGKKMYSNPIIVTAN